MPASSNNATGSSLGITAVKRSPSMNDAHYSMIKFPSPSSNQTQTVKQMSDKLSSRIAADKAAFFATGPDSQQIYENIDKGKFQLFKTKYGIKVI